MLLYPHTMFLNISYERAIEKCLSFRIDGQWVEGVYVSHISARSYWEISVGLQCSLMY